jgi:hypothetical protein
METQSNNNVIGLEYIYNELYKGTANYGLSFASLISFIGGRHVISDLYNNRPDILCNPIIKVIILFSILYMNIKNIKLSIILFFVYIFFVDNYIQDQCNKEYITR